MSKVNGKIISISDIVVISEKFRKRDFVIETEENYPQKLKLQLVQDKVDIIDKYKIGDSIEANINIKGKEWVGSNGIPTILMSLDVWSMNKISLQPIPTQNFKKGNIEKQFEEEAIRQMTEEDDDLPF